jgi:hypothetical protein
MRKKITLEKLSKLTKKKEDFQNWPFQISNPNIFVIFGVLSKKFFWSDNLTFVSPKKIYRLV